MEAGESLRAVAPCAPRLRRKRGSLCSLRRFRVLDAVEELYPVCGQSVGSRPLPQQGQGTQRRIAVVFIAGGNVGYSGKEATIAFLGLEPLRPVAASRNSLGRIEAEEVATRDLVKHTPDLSLRIGP